MTGVLQTLGADWHAAVGRLGRAEKHAASAWQYLTQQAPRSLIEQVPELRTEYATLVSRGSAARSAVSAVRGAVNAALQGVEGAYQSASGYVRSLLGLGDLGLVGLITVGAITAAVTALTYWVTSVVGFRQRVDAIQRLVHEGMTPTAAAAAVRARPGLLRETAGAAKAVAVLIGVGTLAWMVIRWRSERVAR